MAVESRRFGIGALFPLAIGCALFGMLTCAARAGDLHHRSSGQGSQLLTRWRKVGYWGHATVRIPIHARPTIHSPVLAKLRRRTAEGRPEVYLVLSRLVMRNGRTWLRIAIPMRPNGRTGWVVHRALGRLHRVTTWLVIDRLRLRARFLDHGRTVWSAPVGVGAPRTPTPHGLFWITELFRSWQTFFGPYAFGTSAYAAVSDWPGGGVVGVHGTSLPQLVPGRPSHGCVRMRNRDILWLARHMPIGTPVGIVH
jgi:L,D-transpeptidase catalytic domain